MAIIDRAQMLTDLKLYLPSANVLEDAVLSNIINNAIDINIPDGQSQPTDDTTFYSEHLCKSLKASALLNKAKHFVEKAAIKKHKSDGEEIEQFSGASRFAWDDYVKSLVDVCPYLPFGGYRLKRATGIFINPSKPLDTQLDSKQHYHTF